MQTRVNSRLIRRLLNPELRVAARGMKVAASRACAVSMLVAMVSSASVAVAQPGKERRQTGALVGAAIGLAAGQGLKGAITGAVVGAGVAAVTDDGRGGRRAREGARKGVAVGAVIGAVAGDGLKGAIKGAVVGGAAGAVLNR